MPGDFARIEDDGTITLLGRGTTCINTGGEKVFPEEVEGALKAHPDVFDALVVGVPDERLGQRVAALVQPRAGRGTRPGRARGARPRPDRRLQGAAQHLAGRRRSAARSAGKADYALGPRARRRRSRPDPRHGAA